MKALKTLIAIALSAGGLGTAVTLGAVANNTNNSNIEMVEAADSYSGNVVVKDNVGWYEGTGNSQAGKGAVYFYNADGSKNGWSKSFSLKSGTGNTYLASYSSLSFDPVNMIVVRLKNSAPENPTWSDQAYGNQTQDLSFAQYTSMDSWENGKVKCSQKTLSAEVRSSTVTSFGTKIVLSNVGLGGSGHPEVSGAVELELNEEFKILSADSVWSGYYGCPDAISNCFSGGSKTEVNNNNPNIKCLVAGTYDFFFDTDTKRVWLSRQDIVDADGFADYFLKNVGCDTSGATSPSGWATVSNSYSNLSAAAKTVLCNAEADVNGDNIARCVYWYDYALNAHSGLTPFMTGRTAHSRITISIDNNKMVIITVIGVFVLLSSTGTFFLLKKKRKEK